MWKSARTDPAVPFGIRIGVVSKMLGASFFLSRADLPSHFTQRLHAGYCHMELFDHGANLSYDQFIYAFFHLHPYQIQEDHI